MHGSRNYARDARRLKALKHNPFVRGLVRLSIDGDGEDPMGALEGVRDRIKGGESPNQILEDLGLVDHSEMDVITAVNVYTRTR